MPDDDFISAEIDRQRQEHSRRQQEIQETIEKIKEKKEAEEAANFICIRCKTQPCKFSICKDCMTEMSYNKYLGVYGDV